MFLGVGSRTVQACLMQSETPSIDECCDIREYAHGGDLSMTLHPGPCVPCHPFHSFRFILVTLHGNLWFKIEN